MRKIGILLVGTGALVTVAMIACSASNGDNGFSGTDGGDQGEGGTGDGGILQSDGGTDVDGSVVGDPKDCNDAKTSKSYVGCDYWPTVTANPAWSIFDYAVVVSNVGTTPANVTITGGAVDFPDGGAVDGGSPAVSVTVAPGALQKIYLPWVPALKTGDADNCLTPPTVQHSVVVPGGAYHLVSSSPVIVYQFNALEYKGQGGPSGKSWTGCPGDTTCVSASKMYGCFSFSNDASLLLPSTAMTPNYRISGHTANGTSSPTSTFFTVTATQDATTVTATLGAASSVVDSVDGTTIPASSGAGTLTFPLAHAGDVAEIFGVAGAAADFSGSLVQGDKPIQVISGVTALVLPNTVGAADHTEQTVLPVETLGKHYIIPMPDAPGGGAGVGVVRFYGNADGTTLTYSGTPPAGCPTALQSGDVVECAVGSVTTGTITTTDIDVTGDKAFAVALFQEGGDTYKTIPGANGEGDPSETVIASVEQFRLKYLFLAPTDYDQSYADILGESDAAPILDDVPVSATFTPIGSGPYGVWRVLLGAGPRSDGAHTLTSTKPVGLQVVGYGQYTSYQYPGGLNLNQITAPPPPPR